MRYLFRGIVKQTGKIVEGHVEATNVDHAYEILGDNGIITEALRDDPQSLDLSPGPSPFPQIADALESALDSSSSQVSFDDLAARYTGKKVWVIDRDKIRHRVAQVVDSALEAAEDDLDSGHSARQRVANAIRGLFDDNRNIATERNEASIAGMRVVGNTPGYQLNPPPPPPQAPMSNSALEQQIGRLNACVNRAEGLLAAMAAALRNISTGGGGMPRRMMSAPSSGGPQQNEVLLEIFKSNLDLQRGMDQAAATAADALAALPSDTSSPAPAHEPAAAVF